MVLFRDILSFFNFCKFFVVFWLMYISFFLVVLLLEYVVYGVNKFVVLIFGLGEIYFIENEMLCWWIFERMFFFKW